MESKLLLEEFKRLRQVENLSRKLFSDNYFDLYTWYKENSTIFIGFQLVFSVNEIQMALTAEVGEVPNIRCIESGDGEFYDPTDLLDGIGYFPKTALYEEFKTRSNNIDKLIRNNVLKVIETYNVPDNKLLKISRLY